MQKLWQLKAAVDPSRKAEEVQSLGNGKCDKKERKTDFKAYSEKKHLNHFLEAQSYFFLKICLRIQVLFFEVTEEGVDLRGGDERKGGDRGFQEVRVNEEEEGEGALWEHGNDWKRCITMELLYYSWLRYKGRSQSLSHLTGKVTCGALTLH